MSWIGRIALVAANGQFVSAEHGGGSIVVANRFAVGPWEKFNLYDQGAGRFALQAFNGQYVCAEGGGGRELVANRNVIGPWEMFVLIDRGNGQIALKAANGQFVSAEGGGGREVVANRNAIQSWETFARIDNPGQVGNLVLSTSNWMPIGPSPIASGTDFAISGRVQAAAPDPSNVDVLYVAGDNGGIWKNTSPPGWVPVTDDMPSLNFGGYHPLVVHPNNTAVVLGAVSGPGGGILKSVDSGHTWQLLANSQFEGWGLLALGINAGNVDILYVATGWGGVHKSTDGGVNWAPTTLPGGYASDLVVAPSDPQVIYASVLGNTGGSAANNGIYRSSDGGATWVKRSGGLPPGAALSLGSNARLECGTTADLVYASLLTVDATFNVTAVQRFKTTDGGTTWTALAATPGNLEGRSWHLLLGVNPSDGQHVFVNDAYSLYESKDGGETWSLASGTHGFDWVNIAFDANGDAVATADQGVYRYRVPTKEWVDLVRNLQVTELFTLTLDPNDPAVVYGIGQDLYGAVKLSPPSSGAGSPPANIPWSFLPGSGETGKVLVHPDDSSLLYLYNPLDKDNFVRRSIDGGQNWTTIATAAALGAAALFAPGGNPYGLAYTTQRAFVMDPSNPARLLVGTTEVFETTTAADATPTWASLTGVLSPNSFITALAISAEDGAVAYAATDDRHVWITDDHGASWRACETGLVATDIVREVRVDPRDRYHAFAVTASSGGKNVWRLQAHDGGPLPVSPPVLTWDNVSASFPTDVGGTHSLAVDWSYTIPSLYVGTDRGLRQSVDLGNTWAEFGVGLPNTAVSELDARSIPQNAVHSNKVLAAGTYGRGVWEILIQPSKITGSVHVTPHDVPNEVLGIYYGGITVDGNGFIVLRRPGGIGPIGPPGPIGPDVKRETVGLAGVTVYLDVSGNGTLDKSPFRTTTDAKGQYAFDRVPPGTYTVRQVLPAGHAQFKTDSGSVSVNGSHAEGTHFVNVPLEALTGKVAASKPLGFARGSGSRVQPLSAHGEVQQHKKQQGK